MTRRLSAILACALAAGTIAATQATAQTMLGGGGQPSRDQPKKPQYIPPTRPQEKTFPLGAMWTAVSMNGKPFVGADRPSFIVDTQFRARGYGGCNTFAATAFPLREQSIAVGPLAITRRNCDKAVGSAEQAFFVALRSAGKWDLVDSQLVLRSPNGELRFDRSL